MSNVNTGGAAFPTTKTLDGLGYPNQGMTLRDYFAAKAMQGVVSSSGLWPPTAITKNAYLIADAMLAERERGE